MLLGMESSSAWVVLSARGRRVVGAGYLHNVGMSQRGELRAASRAFIAAAFDTLSVDRVIPTSVFHRFLAVGRDYLGDSIRGLSEYGALEAQLNDGYPERFSEPLTRQHPEFASSYVFSFLEACIARCAPDCRFESDSPAIDESIDELLSVLGTPSYEVVCCRHVSHVTTMRGDEVEIGDVTVVPEQFDRTIRGQRLIYRVLDEIPAAPRAWNREDPRPHDPPHSLLITREVTDDPESYEVAKRLSGRLERFLLLARLLTAGTVFSDYEVSGTATLISRMGPLMGTFGKGWFDLRVRRTVRLSGDEDAAFAALGALIDAADVKRKGMSATSFDVALANYNRSHTTDSPYEHLVDLATALEAAMIGTQSETEGLALRLRNRVAALLATGDDPAKALFKDVSELYGLRSKLVHGGQIKERDLRKAIRRVSTVPNDSVEPRFGVAVGYAIDRMRDLVRRAILARLCLAAKPDPLWPFDGDTAVDEILSDDMERAAWRTRWHERLAANGAVDAARPPRSPVDFLSQDDQ